MLATLPEVVIGTSNPSTTSGSENDEPSVRDVTLEILGEQRQEWRDGFDSGLRAGTQRLLNSRAMQQIAAELLLLREVAKKLGEKCDFWMRRSDEMEWEATYWHGVVAKVSSPSADAARTGAEDPSVGGLDHGIVA